jgi:hypothetical protein
MLFMCCWVCPFHQSWQSLGGVLGENVNDGMFKLNQAALRENTL